MLNFSEKEVTSWAEFYDYILKQNSCVWVYRGQSKDFKLSTSIERALRGWDIDQKEAVSIEWQTIREFRRRFRDPQYHRVHEDTLFCLALMQHHGAHATFRLHLLSVCRSRIRNARRLRLRLSSDLVL